MSLMLKAGLNYIRVMLNKTYYFIILCTQIEIPWINTACTKQVVLVVNALDLHSGGAQYKSLMEQWQS
jgi:hypothetical protein